MRPFQKFLTEYNKPLTSGAGQNSFDPNSDPFGSRYSGTLPEAETRSTGLSEQERNDLRLWAEYNPGGAAMFEYLGETYLVNGEVRNVGRLFYDVAMERISKIDLIRDLTYATDENGEHINGAKWFDEFTLKWDTYRLQSMGGDGDGGPTLQEKIDSALAIIQDRVRTLGLTFSESEIVDIATLAVQSSWNDAQVIDRLLTNYDLSSLKPGDLTTAQSSISTLANQYLVPLTDDQAASYAKRLYLGELNTDTIEDQFRKQLIAEMPFLETQLTSGLRPTDIFASARSFAARELELDANNIDLNDPKWRDMFVKSNDDGTQRLATLSEIRTQVRNTPEWSRTTAAKESASNIAGAIAQLFGRSGF